MAALATMRAAARVFTILGVSTVTASCVTFGPEDAFASVLVHNECTSPIFTGIGLTRDEALESLGRRDGAVGPGDYLGRSVHVYESHMESSLVLAISSPSGAVTYWQTTVEAAVDRERRVKVLADCETIANG